MKKVQCGSCLGEFFFLLCMLLLLFVVETKNKVKEMQEARREIYWYFHIHILWYLMYLYNILPVSNCLLSISRSESELILHFFSVALWGVDSLICRGSFLEAYRLLRTAANIVQPLFSEQNSSWFAKTICNVGASLLYFDL